MERVRCISEDVLDGCKRFWTAGQRADPSTNSEFVWRLTRSSSSPVVATMSYTSWKLSGTRQPDDSSGEACVEMWSDSHYAWNDFDCSYERCSVCEIDMPMK